MSEQSYSPGFAKHVTGTYPSRVDNGDGTWEPQMISMACGKCGGTWQYLCTSGNTRVHIQMFAKVHYHGDPLGGGGGSERT